MVKNTNESADSNEPVGVCFSFEVSIKNRMPTKNSNHTLHFNLKYNVENIEAETLKVSAVNMSKWIKPISKETLTKRIQ